MVILIIYIAGLNYRAGYATVHRMSKKVNLVTISMRYCVLNMFCKEGTSVTFFESRQIVVDCFMKNEWLKKFHFFEMSVCSNFCIH